VKIAILGVGSEIIPEDSIGILVAREIKKYLRRHSSLQRNCKIRVFEGGIAPENITNVLRKFSPSYLIILDAVVNEKSNELIQIIPKEKISETSLSTHNMSINILIQYLEKSIGCKSIIIGLSRYRDFKSHIIVLVEKILTIIKQVKVKELSIQN
jgi:hydrogenase 3 maturation protease